MLIADRTYEIELIDDHVNLTGDVNSDIELVVNMVRDQMRSRITEAERGYPNRMARFKPEQLYLGNDYVTIEIMRDESPEEILAREKKEEALQKRRQTLLTKSKQKDLAAAAALLRKHNIEIDLTEAT